MFSLTEEVSALKKKIEEYEEDREAKAAKIQDLTLEINDLTE